MKYIYSQGAVKQVAEMEKPVLDPKFITNGWAIGEFVLADATYQRHLASLLTLPLSSIPSNWVEGRLRIVNGKTYWKKK